MEVERERDNVCVLKDGRSVKNRDIDNCYLEILKDGVENWKDWIDGKLFIS